MTSGPFDTNNPFDRFAITEWKNPGHDDTSGLASGSLTINPATDGLFLIFGDSMASNYGDWNLYTPTGNAWQFNIYDGSVYGMATPVLGASGPRDGFLSRFGDAFLSRSAKTRVVVCAFSKAGIGMADWAPGGLHNHRLVRAILRSRALVDANGATVQPDAILFAGGPNDAVEGVSQSQWTAAFDETMDTIRDLGCLAPIYVALCSRAGGVTNAAIRAAQTAVVNGVDVLAGPDFDTFATQADGTHLNSTGNQAAADAFAALVTA